MSSYRIVRFYRERETRRRVIATGLTLQDAQKHCKLKNTSSSTADERTLRRVGRDDWFDGYEECR